MRNILYIVINIILITNFVACNIKKYDPNWDSLDTRPLPSWYDDAKIGIFVHWGVYCVPAITSEWFWWYWKGEPDRAPEVAKYMEDNYPPNFTYQDFAKDFTAELFDPEEWADIFNKSGAKYVVLTSKHHEGYTMWPSKYSYSWNSMDVGPKRDLVGEFTKAVRATGLRAGLYHSLFEWFNPLFDYDQSSNFSTQDFVNLKVYPEMVELVETYKPEVFWSDGDASNSDYWKSTKFLAWLYNDSPVKDTVVTNDRWGTDAESKHGDFFSGPDRYNPGLLQKHKWENAMTIDKNSWGYRRNIKSIEFMSVHELLEQIVSSVSCGGNILINIGPRKDGKIPPIFEDRLMNVGKWLEINGEGIYSSRPWIYQNDTKTKDIWYTAKNDTVYTFVLNWPKENVLSLTSAAEIFFNNSQTIVKMLGNEEELKWNLQSNRTVKINFPDKSTVTSEEVWTLKISSIK